MDSFLKEDRYKYERAALLKYYNSQCMTHAGYFISMLIGLLVVLSTLLSQWQKIAEVLNTLTISEFIVIPVALIIFVIIIVILLFGCVYALNGAFYWGYLASGVIDVDVSQLSEEEKWKLVQKKDTKLFPMSALHRATYSKVCKDHPNIVEFKKSFAEFLLFLSGGKKKEKRSTSKK